MQRALRYDGLLPQALRKEKGGGRSAGPVTVEELRQIQAYVASHRTDSTPFDIIIEGETPGDDRQKAAEIVIQWAEAGATWWLEAPWDAETLDDVRMRIQQSPPFIER